MLKRLLIPFIGIAVAMTACGSDTAEAGDDAPSNARSVLIAAGFDCDESTPYEVRADEMDLGVEIHSEFTCTKDEASLRASEFESADAADFAVGYISDMACSMTGRPVALLVSNAWVMGEGEEAGTGALIRDAANALDVEPLMDECESATDSTDHDDEADITDTDASDGEDDNGPDRRDRGDDSTP